MRWDPTPGALAKIGLASCWGSALVRGRQRFAIGSQSASNEGENPPNCAGVRCSHSLAGHRYPWCGGPRIPFNPVVARGPWPPSFASAAGAYRRGEMPRRLGAGTLPRLAIAGDAAGRAGSRGPASIATSTPARSGSPPRSSSRASSQVSIPGAGGASLGCPRSSAS